MARNAGWWGPIWDGLSTEFWGWWCDRLVSCPEVWRHSENSLCQLQISQLSLTLLEGNGNKRFVESILLWEKPNGIYNLFQWSVIWLPLPFASFNLPHQHPLPSSPAPPYLPHQHPHTLLTSTAIPSSPAPPYPSHQHPHISLTSTPTTPHT